MKLRLLALVSDFWLPLLLIGCGQWFLRRPPRKINALVGYRTRRSMRNEETWAFAHRYSGSLLYKWGVGLLLPSLLPVLLVWKWPDETVAFVGEIVCLLQLAPLFVTIWMTERALRRRFDDDGRRR